METGKEREGPVRSMRAPGSDRKTNDLRALHDPATNAHAQATWLQGVEAGRSRQTNQAFQGVKTRQDRQELIESVTIAVTAGCAFMTVSAFTKLQIEPWMLRSGIAVGIAVFAIDWFAARGNRP